jgi:signal transduction histidine kinase
MYAKTPGVSINITVKIPHEEGIFVKANELLKDVFTNIVGNAVKHGAGREHIHIDIVVKRSLRDNYYVEVADNGPGIPDSVKAVLFERFRRGKTRAPGKGLGLYIVKMLLQDFKGKVWVEDRVPGDYKKGTRFVVLLQAA